MAETPSPAPAAKLTVKTAQKLISPWALSLIGLRADVVAQLNAFKPEGGHDEKQLANVRAFALAEIETLTDAQAVELKIETQIGPSARLATVLVTKKF